MINTQMGDYFITKSLGKGGFGSVWVATSPDDVQVALKVLNPQVLENERVVRWTIPTSVSFWSFSRTAKTMPL